MPTREQSIRYCAFTGNLFSVVSKSQDNKKHIVFNFLFNTLFQLQDSQQRQMSNDMEINMLQHQILDLQSASDNKAIIAR